MGTGRRTCDLSAVIVSFKGWEPACPRSIVEVRSNVLIVQDCSNQSLRTFMLHLGGAIFPTCPRPTEAPIFSSCRYFANVSLSRKLAGKCKSPRNDVPHRVRGNFFFSLLKRATDFFFFCEYDNESGFLFNELASSAT